AFDGTITHGQFTQGSDVGGILFGNELGHFVDEADEVVVLGNKVSFTIDFDDGSAFAVCGNMQADEAFSGNTCSSFAGLVAQLYAENLFSTRQIAVGFGQCLFALHHGSV